ncbi:M48 family metalloprotease [Allohahella sp. A8]|uniref:M48 family metalloprotease n=1 Tax=Allohahella sp. A8 TaxID=3141461 RepID=UPI003A803483
MDFFQHQDNARRLSTLLCIYFVMAVIGILLAVNVLPFLALNQWLYEEPRSLAQWMQLEGRYITGISLAAFLYGSWSRSETIRQGGEHLAAAAGGQLVDRSSSAPQVQRLVHVVEEMSIASGVPPPRLYIMPQEAGLNAFVAGLTRDDAVLVVTQGLVEALTRDELQAVVGHEFSHIAHEDMKLNSRILVMLGGIMMVGSTGRSMMSLQRRQNWFGRHTRGDVRLFPLGLLLWLAGAIGTMTGRVIQAAICRQREYLADASSVQYTRQPASLAAALYKLMSASHGTGLRHAALAGELNHMCIGESLASHRWLASHPPLQARISAVDAGFLRGVRIKKNQQSLARQRAAKDRATESAADSMALAASSGAAMAQASQAVSTRVAQWGAAELAWAADVRSGLVEQFGERLDEIDPAAVLLVELMDSGFKALEDHGLGEAARLPLLEWLTGTLKQMPGEARQGLLKQLSADAARAPAAGLLQVCFIMYLVHHLAPPLPEARIKRVRRYEQVLAELADLLSLFCRLGAKDTAEASHITAAEDLFTHITSLWFPLLSLRFSERATARGLERALRRLAQLPPLLKPAVIDACAMAVRHDGEIAVVEYELLQISCELLGCPLPPQIGSNYAPVLQRPSLQYEPG